MFIGANDGFPMAGRRLLRRGLGRRVRAPRPADDAHLRARRPGARLLAAAAGAARRVLPGGLPGGQRRAARGGAGARATTCAWSTSTRCSRPAGATATRCGSAAGGARAPERRRAPQRGGRLAGRDAGDPGAAARPDAAVSALRRLGGRDPRERHLEARQRPVEGAAEQARVGGRALGLQVHAVPGPVAGRRCRPPSRAPSPAAASGGRRRASRPGRSWRPPPSSGGVTRPSTRFGPRMRSAARICRRSTPSSSCRARPRRRRAASPRAGARASTPRPSPIWRQPRVSTSKPARRSWSTAPSITESPTASGGAPGRRSLVGWKCCTPPQAACAPGRGSERAPPPTRLPSPRRSGLPVVRVRIVLPGRAGALVGADAPSARVEAGHPRRQLRLLLGRQPALLHPAGRTDAGEPGGRRAVHRTSSEQRAQVDRARPSSAWTSACSACSSTTASSSTSSAASSTRSGSACRCRCSRSPYRSGCRFITFQAISYVVDVKRRLLRAGVHARLRRST